MFLPRMDDWLRIRHSEGQIKMCITCGSDELPSSAASVVGFRTSASVLVGSLAFGDDDETRTKCLPISEIRPVVQSVVYLVVICDPRLGSASTGDWCLVVRIESLMIANQSHESRCRRPMLCHAWKLGFFDAPIEGPCSAGRSLRQKKSTFDINFALFHCVMSSLISLVCIIVHGALAVSQLYHDHDLCYASMITWPTSLVLPALIKGD
nr:hypothetical protein CFP56_41348 [Quercus suber]